MPWADGPFKVSERINDNAYKLDLPVDFGVSPTFNIADLKPYLGEDDELESRMTQMQEGEDDEDIAIKRYIHTYTSIYFDNTSWSYYWRSCSSAYPSSKFTLSSGSSYLDNGDTCTLVLLRNNGLDQKGRGIAQAGFELHDRHDLWQPPRLHPDSVLDVQVLPGKLIKYTFQLSKINSISILSEPQSSIYYRVLFYHGATSPYFGPMGRVSS
jgi:hypothetical protein